MSVNRSIAALGSGRQTLLLQPWLQSLGARHEDWACVELPQLQALRRGNFCYSGGPSVRGWNQGLAHRCVRATVVLEPGSGMWVYIESRMCWVWGWRQLNSLVGYSGFFLGVVVLSLSQDVLGSDIVVLSLSIIWLFATSWTVACQAPLSSQSLFKLTSIESVMLSNHLILCHPVLLLPTIFPNIRVFSNESPLCILWPKHWTFSFRISQSFQWISGLIPFRIDWFGLLAVQETLKSLLQQRSLKTSILQPSAFFMVHLSHPYMTIGKTTTLTIQIFVNQVMSLLFNMLSRFVIGLLPRRKHILISWL